MTFSPPLSLGVSSSAEYLDLEVSSDYKGDLKSELNPFLPEGLKITQVSHSESKYPVALSSINQFEYRLETANGGIDENKFNQSLSRILSAEKIEINRKVKGQFKKVDIRPYIDSITLVGKNIAVKTKSIENRSVRIAEVISELFKDIDPSAWPVLVHREAQNIQTEHDVRSPFGILS
jgi:radical SAM-linked protein